MSWQGGGRVGRWYGSEGELPGVPTTAAHAMPTPLSGTDGPE